MKTTAMLVAAACAAILVVPRPVGAQSTFGAVVGVVIDATLGVLPDAAVTLREVQTGVTRAGASRANGAFEFLNLTQGVYRIEVTRDGFAPYASEPFAVEARQTVRIDPVLALEGFAETVAADHAPLINTETPTVASGTSRRELLELPFTFRTGNTSPIPAIRIIPEVQRGGRDFSLSGALPFQNDVSVDGILTTSLRWNGIGGTGFDSFPSIESIQEIKVSSVSNTAEFPAIGDITTVSRPGTNAFHATALWNANTTALNANPNYFNKSLTPPDSHNHNVGVSAAGPLVRGRTFVFGTFERLDIARQRDSVSTVPSLALRAGDFSSLATPIVDPSTGQPFPDKRIPAARINPVSAKLLQMFIPEPNEGLDRRRYVIDAPLLSNQFDVRVDQHFNQGHTLFGRLSWKQVDSISPTNQETLGPRTDDKPARTFVVSDSYALSPSLLNEARAGVNSVDERFTSGVRGADLVSSIGLRLFAPTLPTLTGTPQITMSGYTNFGQGQEEPLTQDTWQFTDTLTWVRDTHTVKTGFDLKRLNWTFPVNFNPYDEFGVFRFNNTIQGGGTGHEFANFLLGIPSTVQQTQSGPNTNGTADHYGAFIQDEWRVNRALTVSAGLRYDLHLPFTDRENNIGNFLRDTPNGDVVVPDEASRAMAVPGFIEPIGSSRILTAAEAGLPKALRRTDSNNFGPRLGIAWRPGGDTKSVLRAGYGVYYTRLLGQVFYSITGPHTSDDMTFTNQFDPATRTYSIVWPNTYAGDPSRGATRVGTTSFMTANDPDLKDPRTQQWSLTFERELNRTNALRVSYSGFRTEDLVMAPDLNQIEPNTVGWVNLPQSVLPYPNWFRVNTRDNGGYQRYHDVVVQLRGDLRDTGLSYVASYKRAHSIDNVENRGGGQDGFQSEAHGGRTDNRFDPDYLRGKTTNIPDHRFISSLIWNVPVGRGRALASDLPPLVDAIAGGWTLSSVVEMQTGPHLSAYYTSHCGSGTNCFGTEKADAVPGQDPNDGPKTLEQWFNTAAFSTAAFYSGGRAIYAGRFGNADKGVILGPGAWNVDLAAFKDLRLGGSASFRISAMVTNVFNHANWGRPNTDLSSSSYGRITTLNTDFSPLRTIVIGARLMY